MAGLIENLLSLSVRCMIGKIRNCKLITVPK